MKTIKNKKAYHDYEILQTFEAGLMLRGYEIKAVRAGQISVKGSFVLERQGQLFAEGIHITPYKYAHTRDIASVRSIKLLLHKREIQQIARELQTKGVTCVVLKLFFKKALLKAEIAVVRGKKLHDKREAIKQRDQERHTRRAVKAFSNGRY